MNTPKKPGTDLAALKARLAKRPGAPEAAEPPPAAAPPAHAAARAAPAAPMPLAHAPMPSAYDDEPEPAYEPPRMAAPAARPMAPMTPMGGGHEDDPFSGGVSGSFDPHAGVLDGGGDVSSGGSKGLAIFAALGAAALGAAFGWMGHKIVSTNERLAAGRTKGEQMVAEVAATADARKTISLKMDDFKKAVGADPNAAFTLLTGVLTETMDKHPKVDDLFGWQLGAVHSNGIKRVFELYEAANGLKVELGFLAGFVQKFGPALQQAGGPQLFGVLLSKETGALVEIVEPICDLEAKTPCEGKEKEVPGFSIRKVVGGETEVVPKGTGEGQVMLLAADGNIYQFAVGLEPAKNALVAYDMLLGRVNQRLEAMNKAERIALSSLQNYAQNPDVDGSSPQSDPGE